MTHFRSPAPHPPPSQTLAACALALNCLATLRHALDAFQFHATQTLQPRLGHLACATTTVLDDFASQLHSLCPDAAPCPPTDRCPTLTWGPR